MEEVKKVSEKQKVPYIYSWTCICMAAFLIWPLALFLLWRRSEIDRKTALDLGRIILILGSIFIGCGIVYYGTYGSLVLGKSSAFAMLGIVLVRVGYSMDKTRKRYGRYINLIEEEKTLKIDDLAYAMNNSTDEALKDVKKMIELKLIPGYALHQTEKKLIKEAILKEVEK